MGLFTSKEKNEDMKQAKIQLMLDKYNLAGLDEKYVESIKEIQLELMGAGMMEFGLAFSAKAEDNVKIAYLNTLIQQNWIMIRQLDEISKKLK